MSTRRQFLYNLGSISALLPILPSLLPAAHGQTVAKPPLRVVFIGNRNGQKTGNFFPPNPGTTTKLQENVFYKKLSDITGPISPVFGTSWDSLRNKMSLLSGLDLVSEHAGHQIGAMLGCVPGDEVVGTTPPSQSWAASIDWIISQSPNFYKTSPLVTALRYNNYDYAFSFSNTAGKAVALPYLNSEAGVFNQAFASLTGGGGGLTSNPAAKRTLASEKAMAQLTALQSSSRLSSFDKLRLQAHVATLNALKATYVSPAVPVSCAKPSMTYFKDGDPRSKMYSNINDIIVAAFSCDITRMACYSIPDFDDQNNDQRYQHDVISHSMEAADLKISGTFNAWKAERVRDLIVKLDRVIEADGSTMLDNTLVIWSSESGEAYQAHRRENFPILIAGGKNVGAKLKMGYYVDYRTRPFAYYAGRGDFGPQGRPMNQFFVSVMLALGLNRTEFSKYGKNAGKFGDFSPELVYYNGEYDMYKTNYDDVLPFVYTG